MPHDFINAGSINVIIKFNTNYGIKYIIGLHTIVYFSTNFTSLSLYDTCHKNFDIIVDIFFKRWSSLNQLHTTISLLDWLCFHTTPLFKVYSINYCLKNY